MKDIYIIAYAQNPILADAKAANEVELIMPVVHEVFRQTGLSQKDIDFTCSGSCDYLQGAAFAFVEGLSAIQTNPPIKESHVEMDAAWALYECMLKISSGDTESALIYGFGRSSPGNLDSIISLQTDPYYLSPLWVDRISYAALQANTLMQHGTISHDEMYDAIVESMEFAKSNPNALVSNAPSKEEYVAEQKLSTPLNKFDVAPVSDGASAMIICTKDFAKNLNLDHVKINQVCHNIESSNIGTRDLSTSTSLLDLSTKLNLTNLSVDIAELHSQYSHEIVFLKKLLGLNNTSVNASGGPLSGNVMMAAGLDCIGKTYEYLKSKDVTNGLAHATSGPCLQQNMLLHMERVK